MGHTSKPDMSVIWASAGASVAPPTSKIQEGWLAEKPPFQTENWVQQRQDQYLKHLDERGTPEWSNDSDYLVKAITWYNNQIWESLQTPNIGNVPTNGLGFWLSQDYLDRRGDTMTGLLTTLEGININLDSLSGIADRINWIFAGLIRFRLRTIVGSQTFLIDVLNNVGATTAQLVLDGQTGTIRFSGNTIWHAGNDGPGSGLNADLLDGVQLSTLNASIAAAGGQWREDLSAGGGFTVPAGATLATFTVQGGGGGGGGGSDGSPANGVGGSAGQSSIVVFPSGGISITSEGGRGGSFGSQSGPGAGGTLADAVLVQGSTIATRSNSNSGAGEPGTLPALAKGGNGGGGRDGHGAIGTNTATNIWQGLRGGGGAGGYGLSGAAGGGGSSAATAVFSLVVNGGITFNVITGNGSNGGAGVLAGMEGTRGGDGFVHVEYFN